MGNFYQPVPAFLDSLSSEVKLQGTGDQRIFDYDISVLLVPVKKAIRHNCSLDISEYLP